MAERKNSKGNKRKQQEYYGQGYDRQGYPGQGYDGQGYSGYDGQRYPGQGYSGEGYQGDPQGYYGQGYGGQRYQGDPQGYYGQGYGGQGYQGDPQGYYGQGYGGQGYPGGPKGYYDPQQPKRGGKKKKKRRKTIFIIEIIVLIVFALGLVAVAQLGRIDRVKLKDIMVNSGIGKTGYRNIALFGVDSREGELESGTNSDTIMVASINEKTGDIKLVSVYRDTYLDNTNGEYRKATECFSGGGAERSVLSLIHI